MDGIPVHRQGRADRSGLLGYEVMFLDEPKIAHAKDLRSFHVDLDHSCTRVVRELGYW